MVGDRTRQEIALYTFLFTFLLFLSASTVICGDDSGFPTCCCPFNVSKLPASSLHASVPELPVFCDVCPYADDCLRSPSGSS